MSTRGEVLGNLHLVPDHYSRPFHRPKYRAGEAPVSPVERGGCWMGIDTRRNAPRASERV
jgi:hypothetical protein